ncbi:MAG: methylated-DNA--[protein]-cysteine S-methyltransferase [Saccharofermentanales bacterium]
MKIYFFSGKGNIFIAKSDDDRLILCGFSDIDNNANQAKIWILQSETNPETDSQLISKALSFLLYEGFHIRKYHKLNICLRENDYVAREAVGNHQWMLEGTLTDNFFEHESYFNGLLYAIIDKDFYNYSTGMIRFLTGYLIIQATNEAVFNIFIVKNLQEIPVYLMKTVDYLNSVCNPDELFAEPSDRKKILISDRAYRYLQNAMKQMSEYISGERTEFELAYEFSDATSFQKKVWLATEKIPYGQTNTYEEIAMKLDTDNKNMNFHLLSRAVGSALGKNPIMIAVPCHRVIGKDGKLKGFAGGLEVKDFLLSHEILKIKNNGGSSNGKNKNL